ncbi:putative splicing factor 3B subunit 5 [Blattamonas nauphoetae]|uniref:Splicing factor 3B subunit 5 n=1 Tax=Blattamonas nauphoetae TaxID=2049346 RepID=A0ABQ9YKP8_9EUKA|nr:putative splicing factor 3B subunit 5 [Blattamonas nauphoetae]
MSWISSQGDYLQQKYSGTGNSDTTKHEWATDIHRDTSASIVGHEHMLHLIGFMENKSNERVRTELLDKMLQPCEALRIFPVILKIVEEYWLAGPADKDQEKDKKELSKQSKREEEKRNLNTFTARKRLLSFFVPSLSLEAYLPLLAIRIDSVCRDITKSGHSAKTSQMIITARLSDVCASVVISPNDIGLMVEVGTIVIDYVSEAEKTVLLSTGSAMKEAFMNTKEGQKPGKNKKVIKKSSLGKKILKNAEDSEYKTNHNYRTVIMQLLNNLTQKTEVKRIVKTDEIVVSRSNCCHIIRPISITDHFWTSRSQVMKFLKVPCQDVQKGVSSNLTIAFVFDHATERGSQHIIHQLNNDQPGPISEELPSDVGVIREMMMGGHEQVIRVSRRDTLFNLQHRPAPHPCHWKNQTGSICLSLNP